jgi:hypothetical protein
MIRFFLGVAAVATVAGFVACSDPGDGDGSVPVGGRGGAGGTQAGGSPGIAGAGGSEVHDGTSCGGSIRSLTSVSDDASCTLSIGPKPNDNGFTTYDAIHVYADGTPVPRDADHAEGWDYANPEHDRITLYGSVCSGLMTGLIVEVKVSFLCLLP